MYDKLDALIVTAIGGGCNTRGAIWECEPVKREATSRARGWPHLLVEARMRALRRKGRITYSRAEGWRVVEAQ